MVRELFARYSDEQVSIGELARWLTDEQIPTRTGKTRWDRSTIWGMLRNPAYAGRAGFLKTGSTDRRAGGRRFPTDRGGRRPSPVVRWPRPRATSGPSARRSMTGEW